MQIANDADSPEQRFDAYLQEAQRLSSRGQHEHAAVVVQMLAFFAWHAHPRRFFSLEAEQVAVEASRHLGSPPPRSAPPPPPARRRVLHVMTVAYPVGGHTRVVTRWIANDPDCEHVVALTQQSNEVVPEDLQRVAAGSGGLQILDLDQPPVFALARRLRALAADATRVVLHVHPCDVVPLLAFGSWEGRPPVGFFNHADHVFWLGNLVADLVIGFRSSGSELTVSRRGVSPHRITTVPIPLLPPAAPTMTRAQARAQLGLAADAEVLVTVASSFKFSPVEGSDYCALHGPLLEERPTLTILVVGPSPDEPYWRDWSARTGGRIRALGIQRDIKPHFAAADIYVDSAPFGSQTSVLEAAAAGLPVASWRPSRLGSGAVLSSDDPALAPADVYHTDPVAYREALRTLLDDPSARTSLASRLATLVADLHSGPGWHSLLVKTYEALDASPSARPIRIAPVGPPDEFDTDLAAFQRASGMARGEPDYMYSRFLPLDYLLNVVLRRPTVYRADDRASFRSMLRALAWDTWGRLSGRFA